MLKRHTLAGWFFIFAWKKEIENKKTMLFLI